jgi:hypothetical protein
MTHETRTDFDRRAETGPLTLDVAAGRRAFLRALGLGAAGTAALLGGVGLGEAARAAEGARAALTDADILNFALNLEYLEAEFYLRAAYGRGLKEADTTGQGRRGGVTGGRKIAFRSKAVAQYAREIAGDEEAHVRFLRAGLGSARQARPSINLAGAFTAAARAAGLVDKDDAFDAFRNDTSFLLAAFIFEDVGVTAYKGAARFLENKDFLEAAAGILAVEAYHAGEIRTLLAQRGLFLAANRISKLRDSVDGGTDIDQGLGSRDNINIVPTDDNGIAFSRSPAQVLRIVYLGGESEGGFFPAGLNGTIK